MSEPLRNIPLTPEQEAFVAESVKSGRFASEAEALSEGLDLLMNREAGLQRIRAMIAEAEEDFERGNFHDAFEVLDEIRRRHESRSKTA